jgi:hypothetical protein
MGIDGNEMADQLARQGSSRPFIGPEPALGISAKIAWEVIGGWTNRKHTEHLQSIYRQDRLETFSQDPLLEKLENYSI